MFLLRSKLRFATRHLWLGVLSSFLVACDSGSYSLTTRDTTETVHGDVATFGDRYWATLAQDYEPFVPPPELGFAHPPESNISLGRWSDVINWPQIATGAANLPDGRILT